VSQTRPPEPSDESAASGEDRQVLGVDYGSVRIGLALGCPRTGLVIPLPVMDHPGDEEAAVERILEVARGRAVGRIVIGDPLHMSGAASPMSATVGRLRRALEKALEIPVLLQDERLTSAEAEASLHASGLRWWQYDKGRIDALAAMAIVRDHLLAENPSLGLSTGEPPEEPAPPRTDRRARRRRARRKGPS
jgi:putative Holliday junction resolvase